MTLAVLHYILLTRQRSGKPDWTADPRRYTFSDPNPLGNATEGRYVDGNSRKVSSALLVICAGRSWHQPSMVLEDPGSIGPSRGEKSREEEWPPGTEPRKCHLFNAKAVTGRRDSFPRDLTQAFRVTGVGHAATWWATRALALRFWGQRAHSSLLALKLGDLIDKKKNLTFCFSKRRERRRRRKGKEERESWESTRPRADSG